MSLKILIIDDHQMTIHAYRNILSLKNEKYNFVFSEAYCCRTAYEAIEEQAETSCFDLVFLDHSMPVYAEKELYNGLDLGLHIRKKMPNTKIIMVTGFEDSIQLSEVALKLKPDGLIVKSDFIPAQLIDIFNKVLAGGTYFSPIALIKTKEKLFMNGALNTLDRKMISLIALCYQNKSIAQQLGISESTVDKRKNRIKAQLGIEKGTDEDIIKVCREFGLL